MVQEICPYYEKNCNVNMCPCAKFKAYEEIKKPGVIEKTFSDLGFNLNSETWKLLMDIQKSFAGSLHKIENLEKSEVDYWVDKYLVCIEDEIREVREYLEIYPQKSYLSKQNKNKTNNAYAVNSYNNENELKKEIIDILHFVMDLFLCGNATAKDIEIAYLKKYAPSVSSVNDLLKFAYDNQKYEAIYDYKKYNKDQILLLLINKLLDANGTVRQNISWKHWKKPSAEINYEKLYDAFADVFKVLIDLFIHTMDSVEEVKEIYITKNAENIFRQKFNY